MIANFFLVFSEGPGGRPLFLRCVGVTSFGMFDGSMCLISAGEWEDSIELSFVSLCGEFEKSGDCLWSTREEVCLCNNAGLLRGSLDFDKTESFFKLE